MLKSYRKHESHLSQYILGLWVIDQQCRVCGLRETDPAFEKPCDPDRGKTMRLVTPGQLPADRVVQGTCKTCGCIMEGLRSHFPIKCDTSGCGSVISVLSELPGTAVTMTRRKEKL